VPFTQTYVFTATNAGSGSATLTTPIALVGQVLYNGETNFVGYDEGSAIYIVTSGAEDATQTTLADGSTYFVSEGTAPGGYLLTEGGPTAAPEETGTMSTGDGDDDEAETETSTGTAGSMETPAMTSAAEDGEETSGTGAGSGATSTSAPGAAGRVEIGGWVGGVVFGLLALFGM
jgi:hypothetical protein